MNENGLDAISQNIENLDIYDGAREAPGAFAAFDPGPPPAPKLKSKGVIAMDITEQFAYAAHQLELGQLIKDPYFTLFESVGALEIMDPKMDSGYLENGETMEDEYDFSRPLLPDEIIGIIDQLICHEMAWQMGHPLAQTIFTSMHIDRLLSPTPTSLEQTFFDKCASSQEEPLSLRILRAYCLGLLKTCFFINTRVKAEHYYEEEDFVTHTFNKSLLDTIDHTSILNLLEETRSAIDVSDEVDVGFKEALKCRLQFRAKFLTVVEAADSRTSKDLGTLWTDLLTSVPDLKSTTELATQVPTAFSVKIQRRLASTVPPRPIVQVSQDLAFGHLERLCKDAVALVEVLNYHDSHSLLTFVLLFQSRKPQPSVYIRVLLQYYLFSDMIVLGTMSIRQVLDDDLTAVVLPADQLLDRDNDEIEVPRDPRFNMATRMETFRARAAGPYLDLLRTLCQNRCRIRRSLCHTIVDWDNLQLDAEELDQELREFTKEEPIMNAEISVDPIYAFPLSSWSYLYKLYQMEWIVQMGFELEVYQPVELAQMYWYLQYLSKTRTRHLERIRGFVIRSYTASRRKPKTAGQRNSEYANALAYINFSSMEASAAYTFADALSCLFTALQRLSLIPSPKRPYSNDSMRYEVRMKPFLSIGLPEFIPFEELSQLVAQPNEDTLDLLNFAMESAKAAKKGFETLSKLSAREASCQGSHASWVNNIKACLKACIFTNITISTVKKAVEAAGKKGEVKLKVEIPLPGKGYHDWWVVPKVTPTS